SALAEAPFNLNQDFSGLLLTELMYNPMSTPDRDGDDFEFVELKNIGRTELDLSGIRFTNGISYVFPFGSRLAPSRFVVLVSNPEAFSARYPGVAPLGTYTGHF